MEGLKIPQCSGFLAHFMCYRLGCSTGAVGSGLPRFRTIQVRPKDVLAWPWQAEREIEHRPAVGRALVIIGGAYPRGGSHMFDRKRREFITLLGGAAATWPLMARAQHGERIRRIGILQGFAASDPEWQRRFTAFKQGLQELGWSEGRNVTFEFRFADNKPGRLPDLATELAQANVDVIVTNAAQPVEAARKATSSIPIVMATVGDALGAGYVASLARPGGNVTGLTLVATEQSAKRLQLLKEFSPDLLRVAVLWNANASGHRLQFKEMELSAPALGLAIQSLPMRDAGELDAGFRAVKEANAQALVTMDDPLVQSQRARIVEFARQQRVPLMAEFRLITEAGGLMSYGPNQVDMWRRAATYVEKIFKGANPAELPVEQPTKFELVVNLRTAREIGIELPTSILLRADELIE
jgi:putative ABC transport system substrate-binding protein